MTTVLHGRARMTYGLSRSYRSLMAGTPGLNQLCWRYNQKKAVFALCDGRDSPFSGQMAAQFLSSRLVDWLWALPDDSPVPQDELKVRLAYQLNAWAQLAQEQFLNTPLSDGLAATEQSEQEDGLRAQGSETMFICARLDFDPGQESQVILAWAGDTFLRCYTGEGSQVQFDPVRNPSNRWSSILGLRGSLSVARLGPEYSIRRIMAFSPDIGALEPDPAGYTPRRLQSLLQECFLNRLAGDLALFDFQVVDPSADAVEEPLDGTHFAEALTPVHLRYLETSDRTGVLEWSFPTDAVYSVIEERDPQAVVRPVYAGAGGHYILSGDHPNCVYRACVFSPDGKSWSDWIEPVLVDEAGLEIAAVEPFPDTDRQVLPTPLPDFETSERRPGAGEEPPPSNPDFDNIQALSGDLRPLEEIGLPIWPEDPSEPVTPEKETQAARDADWNNWQPSYYAGAAPDIPAETGRSEDVRDAHELETGPSTSPDSAPEALSAPEAPLEEALGWQIYSETAAPEEVAVSDGPDLQPVAEPDLPAAQEPSPGTGWLNFRASRGEQPGEYLLEWEPVAQVRDYQIKKHFTGRDKVHTVRGARDVVKGLEPGRHYFRIRPIYPGPRQEWTEQNLVVIEAPEPIRQAPVNLHLEANPSGTLTITWTFPPGSFVEEYWIYDANPRSAVLLQKQPGDLTQCVVQPPNLETRCKYTVRALNWSGLGPESQPVIYDPPGIQPQPGALERIKGLFRAQPAAAPAEKPGREESITCGNFYELCEQVTHYLKRYGIRMERIRLEQRIGEDHYIPVDSRRTTELVSLNFTKGPDYRLFVFGSKGEVVTAVITFDKMRWNMTARFTVAYPGP